MRIPDAPAPRLFFDAADIPALRAKAAARSGMLDRQRALAAEHMRTPGETVDVLQPYISGMAGLAVAQAYVLTGDEKIIPWVKARVAGLLAMETWFSPVHVGACRACDHVMANVASEVAQMVDLLGDAWSAEEMAGIIREMRRLHFDPFLAGTDEPAEWWFRAECHSNWKIMTCGETGVAACVFAPYLDDAGEIFARATAAVQQVLDAVPAEGDWPEGVGYWFGTLRYGLQYARALRRLTGGATDLFAHPALRVTGDFCTMLTTPAGFVYNFNDCNPEFDAGLSEVLALLAVSARRGDWMAVARAHPAETLLYLAYDDPTIAAEPLPRAVAAFPTTGAASMRADSTFVGLKSGPSHAGHSHLDANSFVIEAGGAPLVNDYRYWPQAHFLGYFDGSGPRWNFDGLATIGHSTLLVDGRGQVYEPGSGGRIVEATDNRAWARLVGEAAGAYPDRLTQFTRSILLLKPDVIIIRDLVACAGERYLEWLLHHAGTATTQGIDTIIEHMGVRLAVTPFLPDRAMGWRVSDVARATTYECSDTRKDNTMTIRYRGFSPLRPTAAAEFLFGLRVNGNGSADWQFVQTEAGWSLRAGGYDGVITPDGETMMCRK